MIDQMIRYSNIQIFKKLSTSENEKQQISQLNQIKKTSKAIAENRVAINSKIKLQKRVYQNSDNGVDHRAHNYRA